MATRAGNVKMVICEETIKLFPYDLNLKSLFFIPLKKSLAMRLES